MGLDRTAECTDCGVMMHQGTGSADFPTDMKCTNCGQDHDMNGRPLAPRSQWGEETGELFY